MHTRQLEVVGTELERERQVGDLVLHGRLDLLVRRGPVSAVLDLKWTRSERRYREEIEEGRAVQLAVYQDRKSTRSELQSLMRNSYAVFCLKKKNKQIKNLTEKNTHTRDETDNNLIDTSRKITTSTE